MVRSIHVGITGLLLTLLCQAPAFAMGFDSESCVTELEEEVANARAKGEAYLQRKQFEAETHLTSDVALRPSSTSTSLLQVKSERELKQQIGESKAARVARRKKKEQFVAPSPFNPFEKDPKLHRK
mmetsp:Transcript_62047/g.115140  ORF Transcript_62047/g.115140 Transcript_62047/m.115140 type:complete len:126 (+) Transcript_62047:87-464(+)